MKKIEEFFKKQKVQSLLALGVVAFVLTFMLLLMFHQVPDHNRDFVNLGLGWLMGAGTSVLGYYFGNSKKEQDERNSNTEAH